MKEKKENTKKEKREYSALKITIIVLIVVLALAVFVQLCVIINLKNKTNDAKNKNDALPDVSTETLYEDWQPDYLSTLKNINQKVG